MPKIDISVEKTIDLANILSTSLPNTIAAKRNAMDHIQYSWIKNAMNTFQKPTGEYTSSFGQSESTPLTGSVYNYSKHAQVVEQGHSGIDLKKMLYTSPKARWMPRKGPNGSIRYIKAMIIPFRHGIPGTKTLPAMPKEIFKQAKKLETSARISEDFAPAISMNQAKSQKLRGFPTKFGAGGSKVERASYAWGGRLKNVGGNYEGMVRMTSGGGYVTFRVMHEESPGWKIPARPATWLAKNTAIQVTPKVSEILKAGLLADLGI